MLVRIGVIIATYGLAVFGAALVVQSVCKRLVERVNDETLLSWTRGGIPNAGRLIGFLERFLVTTLVLLDQTAATTIVLAAKGILRFGEIKGHETNGQRTVAEYVIIGTLLSFSLAVGVASVARWVLKMLSQ